MVDIRFKLGLELIQIFHGAMLHSQPDFDGKKA